MPIQILTCKLDESHTILPEYTKDALGEEDEVRTNQCFCSQQISTGGNGHSGKQGTGSDEQKTPEPRQRVQRLPSYRTTISEASNT